MHNLPPLTQQAPAPQQLPATAPRPSNHAMPAAPVPILVFQQGAPSSLLQTEPPPPAQNTVTANPAPHFGNRTWPLAPDSDCQDSDADMPPRPVAGHKRDEPDSGFDVDDMPDNKQPRLALQSASGIGSGMLTGSSLDMTNVNEAPIRAAEDGNFKDVMTLLAMPGIDVNAQDHDGNSALMQAAQYGHLSVVQALLAMPGIDFNARDHEGYSALMIAAEEGHLAALQALLAMSGIDVNVRETRGRSALMLAAQYGHLPVVQALLAMPGIDFNAEDNDGDSVMMLAAQYGHSLVVQALLDMLGIDFNAGYDYEYGYGALMLAARDGHLAVVQVLLAMPGIKFNAQERHGRITLMQAVMCGSLPVVQALLDMPGTQIDTRNTMGASVLQWAEQRKHTEIAQALRDYRVPSPAESLTIHRLLKSILQSSPPSDVPTGPAIPASLLPYQGALQQHCDALCAGKCSAAEINAILLSSADWPVLGRSALAAALALGFALGHYHASAPGDTMPDTPAEPLAGALDKDIQQVVHAAGLSVPYAKCKALFMQLKKHINRHYLGGMNLMTHAACAGDLDMMRILARLGASIHLPSPNQATPLLAAARAGQWAACAELAWLGALPTTRDTDGYPALYYIASAFADSHTASQALADFIVYLRLKGVDFDIAVPNPDRQDRELHPTVPISDRRSIARGSRGAGTR